MYNGSSSHTLCKKHSGIQIPYSAQALCVFVQMCSHPLMVSKHFVNYILVTLGGKTCSILCQQYCNMYNKFMYNAKCLVGQTV